MTEEINVDMEDLLKEEIEAKKKGQTSTLWFLIQAGCFSIEEIEDLEKRLEKLKKV